MGWQQLAGGRASRKDKAGRPPARSRGPVRGRSLGLLEDVKSTVGRVNGGWVHRQSQAARFDSCLSDAPTLPSPASGAGDYLLLFIYWAAALDPGRGAAVHRAHPAAAAVLDAAR